MIITLLDEPKPENYMDAIFVRTTNTTIEWYFQGDPIPSIDAPEPAYSVTPRQFRQALTAFGYRSAVEAAIASADQNVKDWYEYSNSFDSNNPVMLSIATTMGFNQEQIDNLFILASTL
jgi:hypothetical protein